MSGRISNDELIEELLRLADDLGRTPTRTQMDSKGEYSANPYVNRYGSWNGAVREAGLQPNNVRNISEEDLLAELQRVAEEEGEVPTANSLPDHCEYSSGTYKNAFGSWNGALKAAGLPLNYRRGLEDSDLIEELRRLADDLDRTPRQEDMTESGQFGVSIYQHRFGSWNDALETAGLDLNREYVITEDELKAGLLDLAEELGRTPMQDDMRERGEYSVNPYQTQYGTWNAALEAVGLDLNLARNPSEKDLIAEFQDLADELGRRPTAKDMIEDGAYDWKSYARTFGSWDEGVIAAGYEPFEAPTGSDSPVWVDGYDGYYGPDWPDQREAAIQRDGEKCAISSCDITRDKCCEEYGRDLPVHHIERKGDFRNADGTVDFEAANRLENLITLCPSHHKQYEGLPLDIRHISR